MGVKQQSSSSLLVLIVIISACFLMKLWFSFSTTENLLFILKPVNWLVHASIDGSFNIRDDGSYYYPKLNVLIDKSCSGFNFLIICWGALSSVLVKTSRGWATNLLGLSKAMLIAYVLTIAVNASRIIISITLLQFSANAEWVSSPWFHEALGSMIYIISLLLTYLLFLKKPFYQHAKLT